MQKLYTKDEGLTVDRGTNTVCEYLDWDSEFFGRRIARVTLSSLDHEAMGRVMGWCQSQHIECLYLLANTRDLHTVRLAEENGFHMVDVRITLEKQLYRGLKLEKRVVEPAVRYYRQDDVPALKAIARVSHHDSRFYHDPNFPDSACDALYEVWIQRSCAGYANAVLVAEFQERPVGYITCHLRDQQKGRIGLFAVEAEVRGKRLGQKLIKESLRWFAEQGVKSVWVVTQGRNFQAQRLYQRCGFLTRSLEVWYHRWFLQAK